MESLALAAAATVLIVYGSALLGFVLSWVRTRWAEIVTYVASAVGIATGLWLGVQLLDGNGIMIASIPVALGSFGIWNARRRSTTR